MREAVHDQYEAYPDPAPAGVPVGPGQLDRIDDSLHFGWSWSRHRYCYRKSTGLRILDAGCGTGLSTLGLATLNPGSTVVGLDFSPRSLEVARARVQAAGLEGVEFRAHDLEQPLPAAWGTFDFVVCRGVLGQVDDPVQVLRHLARTLDHRGLLHATFPSAVGRQAALQLRQAVDALAPPEASLEERGRIGLELFQVLRPDHPIRRYEIGTTGADVPTLERIIVGYLGAAERHWALAEAARMFDEADLQFLYAAARWPWRPDRVLAPGAEAVEGLKARVAQLSPRRLAELTAALDPALHLDEFRTYACLAEYEPRVPGWIEAERDDPAALSRLIPHATGLARPDPSARASAPGLVVYRTVSGAQGELDRRGDLLLQKVDSRRSGAEIEATVDAALGVSEPPQARRGRWLDLANRGFIVLESTDPRQHVDCQHLGAIVDRLDCPCPRRWVRECDLHESCSIDKVGPDDEKFEGLQTALGRLGKTGLMACAECPDYRPETP